MYVWEKYVLDGGGLFSIYIKRKVMSFSNTPFNGDIKNGPTFIHSTIFYKYICKNIKALEY